MLTRPALPVAAPAAATRPAQRGLTLVELLVSLALGLLVTAGMLMVFANASAQGQNIARVGLQIENGRYVSELLRDDVRLAGFVGETSQAGALYTQPDPCTTAPTGWSGAPLTFPAPIRGFGPGDVLGCLDHRKAGTDALAVRRLDVQTVDPAALGAGNSQLYVQYSYCLGDVTSPRLVFGSDRTAMTLRNRTCTAPNPVRAFVSRVYYIADCNRCGVGGDSIPTLKRLDLAGNTLTITALAEGIETLRFEYGFDTDGNGSPDTYRTTLGGGGPTADWSNVVSLKVHFITRSVEKATGSNLATAQQFDLGGTPVVATVADGYTRRAYSNSIRLVNPSSVREVQ